TSRSRRGTWRRPSRPVRAPSGSGRCASSVPSQDLEDLVLHLLHFVVVEPGIKHLVLVAGPRTREDHPLLAVLVTAVLEAEPFAADEQKSEHVAEVDPRLLDRVARSVEAFFEEFVIEARLLVFVGRRHLAEPVAERPFGRASPGFG